MSYDLRAFFAAVLHALRAPVDAATELAFTAWHAEEGSGAGFNAFNTTLWQPGCSNYNNFGPGGIYHVRNYPDMATGVRATALTIENGNYPHILEALRAGRDPYGICTGQASHELDVWGTGGAHVRAWLDEHHAGAPHPTRRPAGHPAHSVYVVRAGDNLSAIASHYHVRGGWQELYNANRHTVGPNPDEIRPGERLVIP